MFKGIAAIAIVACFTLPAYSDTIYVPDDYTTIQAAINASANGDTIIVRPGTYYESISFPDKVIVVKSEKGPYVTTICGDSSGSVVYFYGIYGGPVLDGFTITHGASFYYARLGCLFGGGIACEDADPIIRNNVIADNDGTGISCFWNALGSAENNIICYNTGRGISCTDLAATIKGNLISDNGSHGIYLGESNVLVQGNTILRNHGGGIFVGSGWAYPNVIVNNIICDNTSGTGAGMNYPNWAFDIIVNNTITGNTATEKGGGIACGGDSELTVVNTILWNNDATVGPEIWLGSGDYSYATLAIHHSNVEGGQSSVHVEPGSILNWGPGMIDADPLFVDSANGDFHLTFRSPCGNSGDSNNRSLPSEDFEGNPRVAFNWVDIGADEFYDRLYHVGEIVPGNTVDLRVIGLPQRLVTIGLGSGVLDPPRSTRYGDLYLADPITQFHPGKIPWNGVLNWTVTVPTDVSSGEQHSLQALIGELGWNSTRLSNAEVLVVE